MAAWVQREADQEAVLEDRVAVQAASGRIAAEAAAEVPRQTPSEAAAEVPCLVPERRALAAHPYSAEAA